MLSLQEEWQTFDIGEENIKTMFKKSKIHLGIFSSYGCSEILWYFLTEGKFLLVVFMLQVLKKLTSSIL